MQELPSLGRQYRPAMARFAACGPFLFPSALVDRCLSTHAEYMSAGITSMAVDWTDIWCGVVNQLGARRAAGQGHPLTEGMVWMEMVLVLGGANVPVERPVVEHLAPEVLAGKLDLVLDPPRDVVPRPIKPTCIIGMA